jgi:hypothetical protein
MRQIAAHGERACSLPPGQSLTSGPKITLSRSGLDFIDSEIAEKNKHFLALNPKKEKKRFETFYQNDNYTLPLIRDLIRDQSPPTTGRPRLASSSSNLNPQLIDDQKNTSVYGAKTLNPQKRDLPLAKSLYGAIHQSFLSGTAAKQIQDIVLKKKGGLMRQFTMAKCPKLTTTCLCRTHLSCPAHDVPFKNSSWTLKAKNPNSPTKFTQKSPKNPDEKMSKINLLDPNFESKIFLEQFFANFLE